jgi:hypothetical protein
MSAPNHHISTEREEYKGQVTYAKVMLYIFILMSKDLSPIRELPYKSDRRHCGMIGTVEPSQRVTRALSATGGDGLESPLRREKPLEEGSMMGFFSGVKRTTGDFRASCAGS